MMEKIAVVVVNWNLKNDTLECINSLLDAGLNPEEIILIDNGTNDGSVAAFENKYGKRLTLIKNPRNFGYTHAINQGIELALSGEVEWIFLLNNDTLVSPSIFEHFNSTLISAPQFSLISPIIFYHSDPTRIWFFGTQLIPGTLLTRDKLQNKEYNPDLPEIIPIDFINGCGMLVNSQVFRKIGLFDSSLIMYGEEVDFCWRAHLAGFQTATATKAHMWHKVSLSAKRDHLRSRFLKIRNQIIFYRRYTFGLKLAIMFFLSTFRCFILLIKDIINSQTDLIRPLIHGWYSGWFIGLEQYFPTNED